MKTLFKIVIAILNTLAKMLAAMKAKTLVKIVMVLAFAFVCNGFINGPQYVVEYKTVKVTSGMTLWEIADANYMEGHPKNMCLEEYFYNVRHDPKNEHLTANGRILQPGDEIKVPIYKVVKE